MYSSAEIETLKKRECYVFTIQLSRLIKDQIKIRRATRSQSRPSSLHEFDLFHKSRLDLFVDKNQAEKIRD